MKRLLPGEQVIMTVDSTLYAALAVGDAVQPRRGRHGCQGDDHDRRQRLTKEENSMIEIRNDSKLVKLIAAQARGERVDSDQAEHAAR